MPKDLQIICTCSETVNTSPIFFLVFHRRLTVYFKGEAKEYKTYTDWGMEGIYTLQDKIVNGKRYWSSYGKAFKMPIIVYHSHKSVLLHKWPLLQVCYKL